MTEAVERQPLTPRQQDVLTWISGYSPTVREIQHAYGWKTPASTMYHLVQMRKKGHVTWQDGCSRTLRVIGGES
jgi:SOS-response transcriptional repressor LexA